MKYIRSILAWLAGVPAQLIEVLRAILVPGVSNVVAQAIPIVLQFVLQAAERRELPGAEKRELVVAQLREVLISQAWASGVHITTSLLNWIVETTVQQAKAQGKLPE
jgi:hypothetical protein